MTNDTETDTRAVLGRAAYAAGFAPSVHNTQPWRWVVDGARLELYSVTDRQLTAHDPEGHMLLISCGAALHHARTALEAEGWQHRVDRPADRPLAVIHVYGTTPIDPRAARLFEQLPIRRTDRRTTAAEPLRPEVLDLLVKATEQACARLHLLTRDQVIELAVLMEGAQKAQDADDRVQAETALWVGGDRSAGTGIPAANLPDELPLTTVAERDFGTPGTLAAGTGHDNAASYAVLYAAADEPVDRLSAGEALSALWLAATEQGVSLLPLSSPVEVPHTRHELRRLIGDLGFPHMVVRLGTIDAGTGSPHFTPRLPTEQVVEIRA